MDTLGFFLILGFLIWGIYRITKPKLDWNYQTGERILWISDTSGNRIYIILYTDKSKLNKYEDKN